MLRPWVAFLRQTRQIDYWEAIALCSIEASDGLRSGEVFSDCFLLLNFHGRPFQYVSYDISICELKLPNYLHNL
ncbi:hypothetical protein NC652_003608 [Populus alba x Populus x berolinensis]|nr:hypothetical protein NC652_003608 [Populus alba x Populus x berolinensis]